MKARDEKILPEVALDGVLDVVKIAADTVAEKGHGPGNCNRYARRDDGIFDRGGAFFILKEAPDQIKF